MILKNCHIYDEISGKEKISNIIFSDKIMETLDTYEAASDYKTLKLSELTEEHIAKINLSDSKYILDLEGMTVIPGGIDSHVHFDTPGYTDREDFYHGSMSAAAGGITTVIDMPCTSIPPVTNGENFDIKAEAVKGTSVIDYAFYGGIYTRKFDTYKESMNELADKGVKGFKVYFTSGMETYPRASFHQFFQIMRHAKELKIPVLLHAEDHNLIFELRTKYQKDPDDYLRYFKTRPQAAEALSVKKAIEIASKTGGSLHVVHVASDCAARLLNEVEESLDISYETCPHYLYFTYHNFQQKGTSLKTMPAIKDWQDKEMLWHYLADGSCSFVASDHAPARLIEKETGSFDSAYGGIPGTQTLIPVIYSEGLIKRNISLKRLVEITSTNPAKRFGLYPKKGSLQKNSDADLTIIDPKLKWEFTQKDLLSKGETSPFFGETFCGKPVLTILRGKVIFAHGKGISVPMGYGRFLR